MLGELKKKNLLLLVILILALCVAMPLLAMALNPATVTVGDSGSALEPGESVTIPVTISDNPGISACGLTITYDSANLTLNSITNAGGLCTGTFQPNIATAGSATISWVTGGSANMADNGDLFYLNFTVNSSAATDGYEVSCALTDGAASNFVNYDFQNVAVTFEDGTITVAAPDTTAPALTSLVATVDGEDVAAIGDALSCTVGSTVTAIKATMSEPVSFVSGASTNVTMSGGSIPEGTVYGTLSLDASDATNKTLIITPNPGNGTAGLEGTFTFTVVAGTVEDADGNDNEETAITLTVTAAAADDTTAPTLTGVEPAEGAIVLDTDEDFVLTVTAADDVALSELEIDHSMEATLPEFSVYADSANPYGSAEAAAAFAAAGVDVTYGGGAWTIDFGSDVTDAIVANGGISFYLVVKDTSGNSWGSMYTVTDENTFTYTVALKDYAIDPADFVSGVYTITSGGEYQIASGAVGLIQIATTDPVTLVGQGSGTSFSGLSIACTVADADLTIKNLYISGLCSNKPAIGFASGSNKLSISGTSAFNVSSGTGFALGSGSMIHVPFGSTLTLSGDGTLYIYKTGGGANIGGNYGEVNGSIVFNGGTWFLKASQTGSIIGAGQGNGESLVAGDVTINGGTIYAIHVARGAVIGGGGMAGGYVGSGGNVWVNGGTLYLGADYTGASIGGGGGSADNATKLIATGYEVPSYLYVSGGSIKNIITSNAASFWGVTVPTGSSFIVDDTCVSATKIAGEAGTTPAYLCKVDLAGIAPNSSGDKYVVKDGENTIYSGNGYEYDWCGVKSTDIMSYYVTSAADTNLYLYLAGEDQTLTINGTDFNYAWDSATETFTLNTSLWSGSGTEADPYQIKNAADLVDLATYTNEGNMTKDVYWQLQNNIDLSPVCSATLGSWTPIGNKQISSSDVVTGYSFLGDFDGNGYSIENLYVLSASGYLGLFGAIGGNDNHNGTDGYGVVHDFNLYGAVINTVQSSDKYSFPDNVGGVCGKLYAGGTISDVINYAKVIAPCVYNVGGIVGHAGTNILIGSSESPARYTNDPSGANTYILRCGNEARVIGFNKVGGIVGQNAAQVLYSYNKGWVVPHLSGSGGGTGGIAGRNGNNNTAYEEGTISYCYNAGKVTDNGFSWTWASGASNADDSWIRNSDTKWIGGIAGFSNIKSKVRNCYASEFFTTLDNGYTNMKNPIVGHLDTNNTYNEVLNAYCLDTLWYNSSAYAAERGTPKTQAELQATTYGSGDILTLLGGPFVADAANSNNGYPVLFWQRDLNLHEVTVASGITNGVVTAPVKGTEGTTVTVTVTPATEYELVANSLTFTASGEAPVVITATEGVYSFVMPDADVTISAAFSLPAGTAGNPYKISTAADLAALATYTNAGNTTKGLYWELTNDIDLSTVCGPSIGSWTPIGALTITPSFTVEGYPFLGTFDGNGYKIENLYISANDNGLGLFGMIGGTDTPGAAGYGVATDFELFGTVNNTSTTNEATDWCGAVCGKLNAGGTISYVINHAAVNAKCTDNVGGIAGFAGTPVKVHANESSARYTSNPSGYNTYILNCGNDAQIWGYYKLGGIVGENAATVMYCYNTGYILPHMHGSGGGWGGIAGRNGNNNVATEESVIAYCYNTAKITNDGMNDDENETIKGYAGIAGKTYGGKGHNAIYNCYNIGEIPIGRNSYGSITDNFEYSKPDEVIYNNYSLDTGLIHNDGTQLWRTGTKVSEAAFKATTYGDGDILTLLGPEYIADTTNINNGYPVLRWQVGAAIPTLSSIAITTPPTKVAYDATEVFNPAGMVLIGTYADGSRGVITGYTYPTTPLAVGTASVDISYGGFTVTQPITVSSLSLSGIAITANPTNLVYAADEVFDPAGMIVTATYNNNTATNTAVAYDATGAAGYTYSVDAAGLVTVSYTDGGVTQTATVQLTYLVGNAPTASEGVYQLGSADDLLWFANQVNVLGRLNLNAELLDNVDLSGVNWTPIGTCAKVYCGQFDGNGYTVTFNNTFTANYVGIFGYVGGATVDSASYTANIHDLKASGSITATGKSYIAGIAGYVGAGTISDCVNEASIASGGMVGGIAGYVSSATFTNCANKGVITATSDYAAGIAGYTVTPTFTNCTNSANIIGTRTVAGIVSYVSGSGNITSCKNSGTISGSGYVAGICSNLNGTTSNIQYCSNAGSITGTSTTVAGITGTGYGTIDNCYNSGAVQGTYYAGGIVGQNSSAALTNCYNRGAIKGTAGTSAYQASGGICGLGGTGSFNNCYNSGTVTANYAGALVGASNNSVFTLTNCYYLTGTASVAYNERTVGKVVATNVGPKTAVELHALAATLGSAYKTGSSYPILTWQPDEVFSSPATVSEGIAISILGSLDLPEGAPALIDATVSTTDPVTEAKVVIPAALVAQLDALTSLQIATNMGTVTFDSEALANIVANDGGNLTLDLKLTSDADGITVYDLTLTNNSGDNVFTDGLATVTLPYTLAEGQSADSVKVFYVAKNGARTELDCAYANGFVTFTVEHFSTYSVETDSTTVSATSAATNVNVGETFTVNVKINGDSVDQQFASFSAKLGYDSGKVEYVGFAAGSGTTNASAYNNTTTHQVSILESGATKTVGSEGFVVGTVTFRALTSISAGTCVASFAISDATVGSAGSTTPAVTALSGANLDVNLHNHTVTFQAGTGNTLTTATAYVKYNAAGLYSDNSYTTAFTIPTPVASTGYRLADKLWSDGTTTYTSAEVAALAFVANTTMTAQSVKTYTVSFYNSDSSQIGATQTVDTGAYATAPFDPTAPEGMSFAGWFVAASADATYDGSATLYSKAMIDAAAVTADTIYKAYFTDNEYTITVPSAVDIVSGVTSGKAKHGTDVVFTVNSSAVGQGYLYSVSYRVGSSDPVNLTEDTQGHFTIPGSAIVDTVVIQLQVTVNGTVTYITYNDYKGAPEGYKVALLTLNDSLPMGTTCFYNSDAMYWAAPDDTTAAYGEGAFVFFVASDETATTTLSKINLVSGSDVFVDYDGNVNDASGVEINDAQLVYDLYNNYSSYQADFNLATMLMRFEADVNGDGAVGVDDIRLIYSIIYGLVG